MASGVVDQGVPPTRAPGPLAIPGALLGAVAVLAAVRIFVSANTGLTDDEAYYRLWSLAPALSYLDHPPMVAWLIAGGRWLAGEWPFGIRFGAGISALVVLAAVWRTAALLFSENMARNTLWLLLAMPLLAIGSVVITPDTPSVLFYTLTIWALSELDQSDNANWWLAIGVTCGLGLLSKYTNLFAGISILAWILVVPRNRRWLGHWQLWAGGLFAILLFVPVLVWNAQHEWASFAKQFGRVGKGHALTLKYLIELVGGLAALMNPVAFALSIAGLVRLAKADWRGRDRGAALVLAFTAPTAIYFLLHATHDRVQANWLGPLYIPLAIAAAVAIEHLASRRSQTMALAAAVVTGLAMTTVIYAQALGREALVPIRKDPTEQMRGWPALTGEIRSLLSQEHAQWIATTSYATTAQLSYALKDSGPPVVQLNERLRYVHLAEPPADILRAPGIYVELRRRERPDLLVAKFASVRKIGELQRGVGVTASSYSVYAVANPTRPVLSPDTKKSGQSGNPPSAGEAE